jgi:outer membrane immunogenic protein
MKEEGAYLAQQASLDGTPKMISKLLGASVIALSLLLSASMARADNASRPIYKSSSTWTPNFTWTGFYLGANVGFGLSDKTNASGFVDGGTVGYNYQMGSLVLGFEGDYDWSGIKASSTLWACAASATGCKTSNNWIATVRGRIGYAFDRYMPYLTAGIAYGNVKTTTDSGSDAANRPGYAIGAGLEYAITNHWTAKIEYLYVDLSDRHCSATCGSPPTPLVADFKENLFRVGLNYKFNGPTPSYSSRH